VNGALGHHAGLAAEHQVAALYIQRGYRLQAERWRCAEGEIDLIFASQNPIELVFVEVKKSHSIARAATHLRPAQMRRIYRAAQLSVADQPQGQLTPMRFDAALVDAIGAIPIVGNAFAELEDFID
jgi:putative endonuclease